jgi:hypothetical protein
MKPRPGNGAVGGLSLPPGNAEASRSFLAVPVNNHAPVDLDGIVSQARRIVWLKRAVADHTYEIDRERLALMMVCFFARNEFAGSGRV